MMNSCLQKPCQYGFAFNDKVPFQTDYSGAFSYSVSGSVSGMEHDATAFVGCDNRHCCGCYGPVGGTKDYCTNECKPLNGGTITKDVFTWFWVRSALPKKVWNKCMEYNVVEDNGKIAWFKLLGESAVPTEGRCSKNNALLHNGVVVVSDASMVKKIPHVAGLLAYRKDNKELYIRANKTWSVVAQENKVMDTLGTKIDQVREMFGNQIENQNRTLLKHANISDTKFDKLQKELQKERENVRKELQKERENVRKELSKVDTKFTELDKRLGKQNKTLAKQTIKYNSKIDQLDQNLQKLLGNQNRSLTDKLNALTSIIYRLNEQLHEVRNGTFKKKQYGELYSSVILKRRQSYLSKLWEWLPSKSPWNLCYRATKDGWASSTFHSNCNNKGPTVTIVRVGDYVFGGYTDLSWDSSSGFKTTSDSFIFSLKNNDNLAPFKAPVFQNSQFAIYCRSSYGPNFGFNDLVIYNNANSNTVSHANLGHTYQPPSGYSYGSSNTKALLAGSYHFSPTEVEVFYLR